MPLPRGNVVSLRGVAPAERHALHPRGAWLAACLAARLCRDISLYFANFKSKLRAIANSVFFDTYHPASTLNSHRKP